MNVDHVIMELIVKSGEARTLAMEALSHARTGNFEQAENALKDSREASRLAHKMQTALIAADGGEGKVPVTLMMVHAQDHLMTSMLAQDLADEMVRLYQRLESR